MLMLQGTCQPFNAVGQEEAFPCRQSRTSLPSSPAAQGYHGDTAILRPLGPSSPGGCSSILVPKITSGTRGQLAIPPGPQPHHLAPSCLFPLFPHVTCKFQVLILQALPLPGSCTAISPSLKAKPLVMHKGRFEGSRPITLLPTCTRRNKPSSVSFHVHDSLNLFLLIP